MNACEKRILEKTDRHLHVLTIFLVTVMGLLIRFSLLEIVSGDAEDFLLPWHDIIRSSGLYEQVGDYNLLYQFLIWIMTKVPIPPLYAYKTLSCLGDLLLACGSALFVRQLSLNENKLWNGVWTYTAVFLCPCVFLNSAAWAQCDSLYTAFAILGLYFLEKEQYNRSMVFLGISLAFKLQAIFILPVYLFCYYSRRKFSIVRFGLVPVSMVAVTLPLLFWGRNLLDTFVIYLRQTTTWPGMAHNYPSFWNLLCKRVHAEQYLNMRFAALLFTVCVLAVMMLIWLQKKRETSGTDLLLLAFLLVYTCVLFLPSMHERYGYLYEICAILIAILIPRTIPHCIGLLLIGLHAYSAFLFDVSVDFTLLAFANIGVYFAYVYAILGNNRCRKSDAHS